MRMSVDTEDAGYANWAAARARDEVALVYLNGERVDCCITADEEQGYIKRCALDANGKPFLDRANECFVEEELKGIVKITVMPEEMVEL